MIFWIGLLLGILIGLAIVLIAGRRQAKKEGRWPR